MQGRWQGIGWGLEAAGGALYILAPDARGVAYFLLATGLGAIVWAFWHKPKESVGPKQETVKVTPDKEPLPPTDRDHVAGAELSRRLRSPNYQIWDARSSFQTWEIAYLWLDLEPIWPIYRMTDVHAAYKMIVTNIEDSVLVPKEENNVDVLYKSI